MKRKEFIKKCGCFAIGLPVTATMLQSCGAIHYATVTPDAGRLVISRSEFFQEKRGKRSERSFVLIKTDDQPFPICVHKTDGDSYTSSLLKCTHRGCELNVGGGIYSCPCHGSEFSIKGTVLEGPANQDLLTFKTETDNERIYIWLS